MVIDTSTRSSQVREHLLNFIRRNKMEMGEQLPSEAEMAAEIGVSRNTIREAYITLEAEGIIVRKHGIGTFVSRFPLINNPLLDELVGFPENIRSAGYNFDFKIVSIVHDIPMPEICRALQVEPDEEVLQVKQVHFANKAPALYITDYFSNLIDESKFVWDRFDGHMLQFVTEALNMPERHFHTTVQAVLVNDDISTNLSLPVGTPIVNVRSTITSMDGRPVTYSVVYLNPNNIQFELTRVYRHR